MIVVIGTTIYQILEQRRKRKKDDSVNQNKRK